MTDPIERFRSRAMSAGGKLGAVVIDADGRERFALGADVELPAASVIKLPLVMALYEDAAVGKLSLEERIPVGERVAGSGVLRDLTDLDTLSLRDLAALAMTVSDNTAANRLIERVGIPYVNERLTEWGCRVTRLRRAMFDLEAKARGVENMTTAREMASLLARVVRAVDAGEQPSREVLRLLERNTDRTRLGRYLPGGVTLAHRDGWGDDPHPVENDAGIVRARTAVVAVGFTYRLDPLEARPLLGLLGLAAAEIAGADLRGLPPEVAHGA